MNLKAWDNKGATCRLPFRLLLVLTVCGGLWTGVTGGSGVSPTPPRARPLRCAYVVHGGGSVRGASGPGMKEGCSGENVRRRER